MKSLKLNQLNEKTLSEKEMKNTLGGGCCGCGCLYENSGGSSTSSNKSANGKGGLCSDVNYWIKCDDRLWKYYPEGVPYGTDNFDY
jgi:natural product precursor